MNDQSSWDGAHPGSTHVVACSRQPPDEVDWTGLLGPLPVVPPFPPFMSTALTLTLSSPVFIPPIPSRPVTHAPPLPASTSFHLIPPSSHHRHSLPPPSCLSSPSALYYHLLTVSSPFSSALLTFVTTSLPADLLQGKSFFLWTVRLLYLPGIQQRQLGLP